MNYYVTDELCHHGVKGQRWGVRRYQNSDGSLTYAGKKHIEITGKPTSTSEAVKLGAAMVGTTLAIYGTYKVLSKRIYSKQLQEAIVKGAAQSLKSMDKIDNGILSRSTNIPTVKPSTANHTNASTATTSRSNISSVSIARSTVGHTTVNKSNVDLGRSLFERNSAMLNSSYEDLLKDLPTNKKR